MTDEQAFMRRICESPADDLPRLIMADWLEEHGQSEQSAFIRCQIELAAIQKCVPETWQFVHGVESLRRRERSLLPESWRWTKDIPGCGWLTWQIHSTQPILLFGGEWSLEFRRGFVHAVRCSFAEWCGGACPDRQATLLNLCPECHGTGRIDGIGPQLCAVQPVEAFEATDPEGYPFAELPWGSSNYARPENNIHALELARQERDKIWGQGASA